MADVSPEWEEGRRACLEAWARGANARPAQAGAWAPVARVVAAAPWPVASVGIAHPWILATLLAGLGIGVGVALRRWSR